ncbi:MAG: TatD family hydrolase [Propionibacteriaceae bacterium]|nr:TatD family hydrolase [Propionibacteriaceae bacterium]
MSKKKERDLSLPGLPEALPSPVTDAHTHLGHTIEMTKVPAGELIAIAATVGVTRLVEVGTDLESSVYAVRVADANPAVVAALAIHPNDAARGVAHLEADLAEIERLLSSSTRVRAVGETGLDYFRTLTSAGQKVQRETFAAHIDLAKRFDLPLVIHERDAHYSVLDVLDAEGCPEKVMMHCFSGDAEFAKACLDRGFWLSFPGTITFKPNEFLREALRVTPQNKVLVETDAPFLTPMPYRGRPNASFLIPVTVRFMARHRGDDLAGLCAALHQNATDFFGDW